MSAFSYFNNSHQITCLYLNNDWVGGYGRHPLICLPLQKAQEVYLGSSDCFEGPCSLGGLGQRDGQPRALGQQWDSGERGPSHRRLSRPTPIKKDTFISIHSNMICIALTPIFSASVAGSSTMYDLLGS